MLFLPRSGFLSGFPRRQQIGYAPCEFYDEPTIRKRINARRARLTPCPPNGNGTRPPGWPGRTMSRLAGQDRGHSAGSMAKWCARFPPGEIVRILVRHEAEEKLARGYLQRAGCDLKKIRFIVHPTNRGWMRDSGPIFVNDAEPSGRPNAELPELRNRHRPFPFQRAGRDTTIGRRPKVPEMAARVLRKRLFHAECRRQAFCHRRRRHRGERPRHVAHDRGMLSASENPGPQSRPDASAIRTRRSKKYLGVKNVFWLRQGHGGRRHPRTH